MFSRFRNFVSRHKRKFIVVGVVFGASGVVLHYVRKKLIEFQEAQAREFIEKTRRIQHFESTERTCNQAIKNLIPSVLDVITKQYDTSMVLQKLRDKTGNLTKAQKMELWNELLVKTFSRVITFVYSSTILVISLRVQLNILAGFIYKEIDKEEKTISPEIQNSYLAFIEHFLKNGIQDLASIIQESVERTLKKYDFKQTLDLAELEQIFWSIQMSVNQELQQSRDKSLVNILFSQEETNLGPSLQQLLTETLDMIETDEVFDILTSHIGIGFSSTTDEIASVFSTTPLLNASTQNKEDELVVQTASLNISQVKVPLAKLIPIIDNLTKNTEKPLSNILLNILINSEKIKMLGANTYEVFSS